MGKSRRTEYLFKLYSTNLAAYAPHLAGRFVCPLCGRVFGVDALSQKALTVEHIVPRKLGGNVVTLTCRECNSRSGTQLEGHLVRRFRFDDAFITGQPLRGRVQVGEGEMGAEVVISGGEQPGVQIFGVDEISNPELKHKAEKAVEEAVKRGQDFELRVTLPGFYKELRSRVAILRSAYLLMFRQFGYGYIGHPNLNRVRQQLDDPDTEAIVHHAILHLGDAPLPNFARCGVSILVEPPELRCFLVTLDLSTALVRHLGIIMPGLDSDDDRIYERASSLAGQFPRRYHAKWIPYDEEVFVNPEFKGYVQWLWRNVGRGSNHTSESMMGV